VLFCFLIPKSWPIPEPAGMKNPEMKSSMIMITFKVIRLVRFAPYSKQGNFAHRFMINTSWGAPIDAPWSFDASAVKGFRRSSWVNPSDMCV